MIHHVAGAKHELLTRSGLLSQKRGILDVMPDKYSQMRYSHNKNTEL